MGVDGIRVDALRYVYENENMKDEPIIDPGKPADFNNLEHLYTADQEEVYNLIEEWLKKLDEFKKRDNYTRYIGIYYQPQFFYTTDILLSVLKLKVRNLIS